MAIPILALCVDDWARLIPRWWSDANYTHGFFVPLFSLYLVWEKWDKLVAMAAKPSLLGLPFLVVGIMVKMGTLFYDSLFLSSSSMVLVILGSVLLTAGARVFRAAAVPILFLFLMLPLPLPIYERIAVPLQVFAAEAGTVVLQGLGVPAACDGNVIQLARRDLEVAGACSGMRLLTGFIALGIAFAYLTRRPLWERLVLVASTIPIAILANVLRVIATSLFAHWGYDSLAEGAPHAASAMVLFAFSALVLWGEHYMLSHLFVSEQSPRQET